MGSSSQKDNLNKLRNWTLLRVVNLFLAVISGWALKNVAVSACFSSTAFCIVLLHSIFGILYFTYPANAFRRIYLFSGYLVQFTGVSFVTADALRIINQLVYLWLLATLVYTVIGTLALWLHKNGIFEWATNVATVCNFISLIFVGLFYDECYWTIGLAVLILLNHFAFRRLAIYYDISHMEIATVGLCFFVIFALNTVNELTPFKYITSRTNGSTKAMLL